jgi:geranylgeranyl reductase family protein
MVEEHDITVVGAGPGGAATAYYLAQQGLDVLLVDKASFPRSKTCGDGLTPAALRVVEDMGILGNVAHNGYRITNISIHSPRGYSVTDQIPEVDGYPNYLITHSRLSLDQIFLQHAIAAGVKHQGGIRVNGIENEGHLSVLHGTKRSELVRIKTRLVVLATGANPRLLLSLGILYKVPPMVLAARTYYDGLKGLDQCMQVHTEGVPMPGYGWVFPISQTSANIGIGYWPAKNSNKRASTSSRNILKEFLRIPSLKPMLKDSHQIGPIKGYPIRVDFPTAPTFGQGILVVGEAAGLVSPLTGEGIDMALESGRIAARHIAGMFASGDFSIDRLEAYDAELRQKYQRLFLLLARLRRLYVNPLLADRVVRVAAGAPELKRLLVDILLGYQDAAEGLSPGIIWRVIRGN